MTAAAPAGWRDRLVRGFRWHRLGFLTLNLALTAANIAAGPPWWALWPLLATGLLLALHAFFCKAFTVDERWAQARVAELNLKSYDRGHIEDIKFRHADAPRGSGPKQS